MRMIFPGISPTSPSAQPSEIVPAAQSVSVGLLGDRSPAKGAYAWVRVPDALGVGGRVKLQIDRAASAKAGDAQSSEQVQYKVYWGCADQIPEGQPSSIIPAAPAAVALPDKSAAFWPGLQDKPLSEGTDSQGLYTLETNYLGATSVTLGPDQAFLAPIKLVNDPDKIAFSGPIRLQWHPVPRATGYLVTAFGGTKDQSMTWTSSSDPDAGQGIDERAISDEELKSLLARGVLLKTTSCTIPAGVFAGAKGAMITVTAFGRDLIQDRNGIETRVIVRSAASVAVMAQRADSASQ
jgi:hypothetical protein